MKNMHLVGCTLCRRFLNQGYLLPKPLINIVGRPMLFWLLDNLKFEPEDILWIGVQRSLNMNFGIEERMKTEYPSLDFRLVEIDFQTRGAAETLYAILQVTYAASNNDGEILRTLSRNHWFRARRSIPRDIVV